MAVLSHVQTAIQMYLFTKRKSKLSITHRAKQHNSISKRRLGYLNKAQVNTIMYYLDSLNTAFYLERLIPMP